MAFVVQLESFTLGMEMRRIAAVLARCSYSMFNFLNWHLSLLDVLGNAVRAFLDEYVNSKSRQLMNNNFISIELLVFTVCKLQLHAKAIELKSCSRRTRFEAGGQQFHGQNRK